jgi:calcineurin-like phosphoesterase family protein
MKLQSNNIWFTSDTHYGHNNIVSGVTKWRNEDGEVPFDAVRNFPDVETMNDMMVDNINKLVEENDYLIHLGDWSFGGIERVTEFRERINCKNIVLMLGNHDHHIQKEKHLQKLFTHVTHYEELKVTQKHDSHKFILCHYPIISWNNQRNGAYMLHGHQHLKGDRRFCDRQEKRMDIGLCGSPEFRPYHIDELVTTLNNVNNRLVL